MKKILFSIALIGFSVAGAYAQNAPSCTCQKIAKHHKAVHQKVAVGIKTTTPPLYTNRTHNKAAYPGNDVWSSGSVTTAALPVVSNTIEYNSESSYTGNYPKPTLQDTRVDPREDNNKSPNVSGLCLYDCSTK